MASDGNGQKWLPTETGRNGFRRKRAEMASGPSVAPSPFSGCLQDRTREKLRTEIPTAWNGAASPLLLPFSVTVGNMAVSVDAIGSGKALAIRSGVASRERSGAASPRHG